MLYAVLFHAVRCNITGRECLYTDGGILDQYPIHCFDGAYSPLLNRPIVVVVVVVISTYLLLFTTSLADKCSVVTVFDFENTFYVFS